MPPKIMIIIIIIKKKPRMIPTLMFKQTAVRSRPHRSVLAGQHGAGPVHKVHSMLLGGLDGRETGAKRKMCST